MVAQVDVAAHQFEVFLPDLDVHLERCGIGQVGFTQPHEAPRKEFEHLAPGRQVRCHDIVHDRDHRAEPVLGNRLEQRVLAFEMPAKMSRRQAGTRGQFVHGQRLPAALLDNAQGNADKAFTFFGIDRIRYRHGRTEPPCA